MNNPIVTKIYTGYIFGQLAPATLRDVQFNIVNSRHRISIKSVYVDYLLRLMPINTAIIPPEANDIISLDLTIFVPAIGFQPASPFTVIGGAMDSNGAEIHVYKRGQQFFDRLFAENIITFRLQVYNMDAINTIFFNYSLAIETDQE